MNPVFLTAALLLLADGHAPAQESTPPTRADKLKAIRAEFDKANGEMRDTYRSGKMKADKDGQFPEWTALLDRTRKQVRELIDADPADAVGLDGILFWLGPLNPGKADPVIYIMLQTHHVASPRLVEAVVSPSASAEFLRTVAAKSPHASVKARATYHLAENLYQAGKPAEAVSLLEAIRKTPDWAAESGYGFGTLADTAGRLLFEVRRLNVGQEIPEIDGRDLDGKPLKLSESRGKATLLVFWATWCGPCMAMVPHERALVERYAGRPFTIVGVNGDILEDSGAETADGKKIDNTARVKAAVEKEKISWRSFRNGQFGTSMDWNVRTWPTMYLIDHKGVIRGKWHGDPGTADLDAAVDAAVKAADAKRAGG